MVDIRCPFDGSVYHAEESHIGKSIRCQKCGSILRVEHLTRAPVARIEPEPIETQKAGPPSVPAPVIDVETKGEYHHLRRLTAIAVGLIVLAIFAAFFLSPRSNVENTPSHPTPETSEGNSPNRPPPDRPVEGPFQQPATTPLKMVATRPTAPVVPRPLPPCAVGEEPERLETGQRIVPDEGIGGLGTLSVNNDTTYDALVRVADVYTGRTARLVYVRSHDAYTMDEIEPGAYHLRFLLGRKWVWNCVGFLDEADFQEFERTFVFSEDDQGDYIEYDKERVTLHPVLGGNAPTKRIGRKRFLEGDQHFTVQR